jgi:hypothetical protein
MGASAPPRPGAGEAWAVYITAKTAAEANLRTRDLAWTILRPGPDRRSYHRQDPARTPCTASKSVAWRLTCGL